MIPGPSQAHALVSDECYKTKENSALQDSVKRSRISAAHNVINAVPELRREVNFNWKTAKI